jgi:hypothetical protein
VAEDKSGNIVLTSLNLSRLFPPPFVSLLPPTPTTYTKMASTTAEPTVELTTSAAPAPAAPAPAAPQAAVKPAAAEEPDLDTDEEESEDDEDDGPGLSFLIQEVS